MKRFKNILAVYNEAIGADDALSQAAALARSNGAHLSVVDLLTPSRNHGARFRERRKRLERTANALRYDGVEHVSTHVLAGDDVGEIIACVMRQRHDLVIASVEGGNPVINTLYGTLATQLMRKCPCPVWILKPGQDAPYARILAAVDPDPADPAGDPINVKIMDLATSLAKSHDAELHIVHAWEVTGDDRHTVNSEVRDTVRSELVRKHEDVRKAGVSALAERYSFLTASPTIHLPRGLAEREIAQIITEQGIDLTVMGMATRSGLSGFLAGNAAETILTGVRSGVLTVKPEGFEAPVTLEEDLEAA